MQVSDDEGGAPAASQLNFPPLEWRLKAKNFADGRKLGTSTHAEAFAC